MKPRFQRWLAQNCLRTVRCCIQLPDTKHACSSPSHYTELGVHLWYVSSPTDFSEATYVQSLTSDVTTFAASGPTVASDWAPKLGKMGFLCFVVTGGGRHAKIRENTYHKEQSG